MLSKLSKRLTGLWVAACHQRAPEEELSSCCRSASWNRCKTNVRRRKKEEATKTFMSKGRRKQQDLNQAKLCVRVTGHEGVIGGAATNVPVITSGVTGVLDSYLSAPTYFSLDVTPVYRGGRWWFSPGIPVTSTRCGCFTLYSRMYKSI